jgi:hypothetical protein
MNADLLRQRRNLIAISAVLLIFDFADVKIAKISVLGTELLVGNAQVLMVCAWGLWAYFLLRYYQYLRTEPHQHIRNAFKKKLDEYARSYARAVPLQDGMGGNWNDYKISRSGFFSWTYIPQVYDPVKGGMKDEPTTSLPAGRLAAWLVQSAAFVCVQTPHATDHILPFVLAVAAPIVTIYTRWQPYFIDCHLIAKISGIFHI